MSNYYSFVAGLPEIQLLDAKAYHTTQSIKALLEETVNVKDWQLLSFYYGRFDNHNLLIALDISKEKWDSRGNYTEEEIQEMLVAFREEENPHIERIPSWFRRFIPAFQAGEALYAEMSWEDQLLTAYFEAGMGCKNQYIAAWFTFQYRVRNVMTAFQCRKFGLDRSNYVLGEDEFSVKLRTSSAKDFGVTVEFPYISQVLKVMEMPNFYDREKALDALYWNYIEENTFFHYFSLEKIFAYLIQLEMIERWSELNEQEGMEVFREFVNQLKSSFRFQDEFSLKR
ncbi:DUF2764 domain-containing protein [Halosquirtibacter laminarini]|uniref:DUF2764 domain-containing protein n=1 Tax=Halosquirtibacter laminarini TaxID=3374600 RepID=A0AC61NJ93_9BACT|nr:DUF2764 domain-containing protein [Prolixibacteraceae bacterium]